MFSDIYLCFLPDTFALLSAISSPLFSDFFVARVDQIDVEIDKFLREHHSLVPHFSILLLYFLLDVARKLTKWNELIAFLRSLPWHCYWHLAAIDSWYAETLRSRRVDGNIRKALGEILDGAFLD